MAKPRSAPDMVIIIVILLLLTIGVIMVYSASAAYSHHKFGDSFFYAKRQMLFAALGVFDVGCIRVGSGSFTAGPNRV